ncbi:hypothetical protein FJTKL_04213 [Diaporthe vaccinii]|uniref:Uncharacterized protein n=1 Tax=Diaporthe vaccinii TaxID=105482 RepID=A0ABR4DT90_9PEZI
MASSVSIKPRNHTIILDLKHPVNTQTQEQPSYHTTRNKWMPRYGNFAQANRLSTHFGQSHIDGYYLRILTTAAGP